MKKLLLPLVLFTLVLGACSKEYIIERKEDKIIGAWEIDKVFYKKDFALFRDDISYQFRNNAFFEGIPPNNDRYVFIVL